MDNKPVLIEVAIFVVSGILFIMLMFKLNSYVQAEKKFQSLMMRECIQSGSTKETCERMALDRVWTY
jgi:hypothetical protein